MAEVRFDRSRVWDFLERAGRELTGEWLLVGGAAAASWFAPGRTTEDIDLIGLAGTQAERLALMQLASDSNVPIEAVNSAADYFVRKIPDWRDHLVELHRGPTAVVYRPTATLFVLLKLSRMSETDGDDCIRLLDHCAATGEVIDRDRLRAAIDALPPSPDEAQALRRSLLRSAVSAV